MFYGNQYNLQNKYNYQHELKYINFYIYIIFYKLYEQNYQSHGSSKTDNSGSNR